MFRTEVVQVPFFRIYIAIKCNLILSLASVE